MEAINQEKNKYSPAQYLALEERAVHKSEYHNGQILAMSGGTLNHSLISANMIGVLRNALKGQACRVLDSNLKVYIEQANHFVYPDGMVICDAPIFFEERKDVIQNPILVVEVLSDSTEAYDRSDKFQRYMSLPSFQEYVLINQKKKKIEVFYRQDEKQWIYRVYQEPDTHVFLNSLHLHLEVVEIYDKVSWD